MLDRATRSLVTTGVLAIVTAALGAQQPPQQTTDQKDAQQQPRFRVESNFVRIDAYPLRDGKPVMDLKGEDFQVFEDGVAQKVETFEHVVVRPAGPQSERTDVVVAARVAAGGGESAQSGVRHLPRHAARDGRQRPPYQRAADSHARSHHRARRPRWRHDAGDGREQIVLGRKTQVIEDSLRTNWPWGTRFSLLRDEAKRRTNLLWHD